MTSLSLSFPLLAIVAFIVRCHFVLTLLISFTTMHSIQAFIRPRSFLSSSRSFHYHPAAKAKALRNSNSPSFENLPPETLYILDGTAMLYQAHFSRESREGEFGTATFTPTYAEQLRRTLPERVLKGLNARDLSLSLSVTDASLSLEANTSTESVKIEENTTTTEVQKQPIPCGAIGVMAMTFARFVGKVRPEYVAAVFDTDKKTFRSAMLPSYKKQRPEVSVTSFFEFLSFL
jgi:hypothetical protein